MRLALTSIRTSGVFVAFAPGLVAVAAGCGGGGSGGGTGGGTTMQGVGSSTSTGATGGVAGSERGGASAGGSASSGGAGGSTGDTGGSAGLVAGAGGSVAAAGGMMQAGAGGSSAGAGAVAGANLGGAPQSGAGGAPAGAGGAAGSATGGSGGTAPLGSLTVTNLKVEANPRISIACYVSWTSSEAANSEVQFGTSAYQFRIVDDKPTTDHKVHVVGMHPETMYKIKAVSTSATATGSAESTFAAGKMPANSPAKATVVTDTAGKVEPGWTLTNYFPGGSAPGTMLMVDEAGLPVWYYVHGTTADQFGMTSTVYLSNGHVLIGNASQEPAQEIDLEGNVIWAGPTSGTPAPTHHTSKLMNGDYAIVRESNSTARVEELSPDNKVVWTWDLYDYIKPKTTAADWCHVNSVTFDEVNDFLYFNCRFQGLFKVDRKTKNILWQLGAAIDDSMSGDIGFLPDNSARINDTHDPEIHANGTIMFYDNQGWSSHTGGEGNGSYHTRVVEYQLDEAKKQATLVWEFPGTFAGVDDWYKTKWSTPIWGDANRLPNGNVLVTAGLKSTSDSTRIFEVTNAGEVVWAITWAPGNGSYRANRLTPPVQAIAQ